MHYTPEPVEPLPLSVGDRVRFEQERRKPYTVRAASERFAVVTRQADFKPKGELFYAVIDWGNGVRGPVDTLGRGWDTQTDERCMDLLRDVEVGKWNVSQRNWLRINIIEHIVTGRPVGANA